MLSKRLTSRSVAMVLLAAAMSGPLRAAELGEIKVNSFVGQQLSADIELVDLTSADLADLRVRLANPDVFKGAGLDMPPELAGLHISIAPRESRRFLHLTTLQPVNAEALHLFLELNSGGRQLIRAASLWLAQEPAAQRAARIAVAAAAPSPAPVPPAAVPPPAEGGEAGLNEAAQRAFAYRRQKAMEQAAATAAPKPEAEKPATVQPALARPPGKAAAPIARAAAPTAVAAPSCAPAQQVAAEARQCQAMESKLADIEGKVRGLQKALSASAPAAVAHPVAPAAMPKPETAPVKPAAAPAKPGAAPVKPGATPVKPGVAADLAGNPRKKLIMLVAGGLAGLAALAGVVYFLRKRQAKGPLKIWQSFRRKGDPDADVPVLEEVEEVAAQ